MIKAHIVLRHISVKKHKIEYSFDSPQKFHKYLRNGQNTVFSVEYPEYCDLRKVPTSVLMIPFVANMLK